MDTNKFSLASFSEKSKNFWSALSSNQRILIVGAGLVMMTLFILFILWLNKPNHKILYTNLTSEDANKIVTYLETEKVPYSLVDEGQTITVPSEQVYDLRIKIAGEGNLVGQGIGFEIFDEIQMGQTEFVQRINYQRALQGELARTLSELPNVETARVHLVLPERSLFIEEQQEPSASVVLMLENPSMEMSKKEVNGVLNLLVMSVEGLDKYHVSITDSNGKAIYTPEEEGFGANSTQLDYRVRYEKLLESRINELLSPILGPGKAIAKVNASLDYSQRTIRREIFDPESQVVRSEQTSEEVQQGSANLEAGSPDANFRGDGLTGSVSTQDGSREQATINYEINKVEENIIGQMGEVERLTIAVAVDGTYVRNENGEYTYVPRSEEELTRIRQLVSNAVGFDNLRGDTIEVSNIAFGENNLPVEPSAAALLSDFANRMIKPILTALLALFFILLVVRPIVLSLIRPRVESGEVIEGLEGLPAAEEQYALFQAQEEEARMAEAQSRQNQQAHLDASVYAIDEDINVDDLKAKALQLAERNMEQTIIIVRDWMNDAKPKLA